MTTQENADFVNERETLRLSGDLLDESGELNQETNEIINKN